MTLVISAKLVSISRTPTAERSYALTLALSHPLTLSLSHSLTRATHLVRSPGTVSGQHPHLVFDGFNGKLGERVKCVLRHLFPAPRQDERDEKKGRVLTFANIAKDDYISFRHHAYSKNGGEGVKGIDLVEKVGGY